MSAAVLTADMPAARKAVSPWLIAPVVALAAFMEVLDTSIANVALSHIAGALGAAVDESTWVLTSYTVTNVMVVPISGWLSSVLGRKNYFTASIVGFSIASLLCGFAPSLGLLVAFRALQGITGGGLQPVSQAILMDAFPPAQRGIAMAVYGLAVVFAPAIGPTLGGWITDNFDWRWVFLVNVPVGMVVCLLVRMLVSDPDYLVQERAQRRRAGISLDYIGLSLLVAGVGFLQVVLDRGQQDDWFSSHAILLMAVVSVVALVAFVIWELNSRDPLVDLRLLKHRNFAIGSMQMFALGLVVLSSVTLVPLFVQELLGYTATDAGLVMTAGGCIMVLAMPATGLLVSRFDARWIMAIGFAVCGLITLYPVNFDLSTSFSTVAWNRVVSQASMALMFISINVLAYEGLPQEKSGNASALINMFRNLGASVGISLATTWLARRAQYHQSVLAEQSSALNPHYQDALHGLTQTLGGGADAAAHAVGVIYADVLQQANLLAFLDDFWLLGAGSLALIPLAFVLKKSTATGLPGPLH
jgi:DHA2 family multidrug resistance protein